MAPVSKNTKHKEPKAKEKPKGKEVDGDKDGNKKRKKANKKDIKGIPNINYSIYVHKILKKQHPELSISSSAMEVFNKMTQVLFDRLAKKASNVTIMSGKKTMGCNEMHQACKLLLPGELSAHASNEGVRATVTYIANN